MPADRVRTGTDAVIRVWLENRREHPLRNVDVSIGIDNYAGERITILTTDAVGETIGELPPGLSALEFRLPGLPLVSGRYYFTLFGTASGEIADWLQSAISFTVEHGDFFGTGRAMPSGQGSILLRYSVRSEAKQRVQLGETGRIGSHR